MPQHRKRSRAKFTPPVADQAASAASWLPRNPSLPFKHGVLRGVLSADHRDEVDGFRPRQIEAAFDAVAEHGIYAAEAALKAARAAREH